MPRILFIDQTGQLGGAELCLADIAAHHRDKARVLLLADGEFATLLRERDVETELLPLPSSVARAGKKSLLPALASLLAMPGFFLALRRRIRAYDLVYMNTAKALVLGTLAAWGLRRPAVFHLHDIVDDAHFSVANIRLLVTSANRASLVIANSEATARAFVKAGGRTPVRVIPNGFDPATCEGDAANAAKLRDELAAPDQIVAAIFGRLAPWKGQHLLIDAIARTPGLTAWIVGEALFTDEDRRYADSLQARAQEAGVAERVRFLGFRHDIPDLMRAADVVVNCSVAAEPFGRVLVEGMLAGKPVVAPRDGGPLEIVEDGVTGLLVEPGNADALAKALEQLRDGDGLRASMGHAGRARAKRLFSLDAVRRLTDDAIAEVMP